MPLSRPTPLQTSFVGMRRDMDRSQIGANYLWNLIDFIPNRREAPLDQRGPWGYAGSAFGGSPGRVIGLCDAPQNGGHYLLAVDSKGQVYRTNGNTPGAWAIDGTTANVGAIAQNPIFFLDTVVFPSSDGSASLHLANENTVTTYSDCGVTHKPTRLTQWKNRLVGASGEYVIFGPPIGVTGTLSGVAWDENATYGVSQPIVAIQEIRGAIMLMYDGSIQRMRGTTPAGYGITTDDIVREDLFGDIGCIDARSVTRWNDFVLWADKNGIYMTDGAAPVDLTEKAGLKRYYIDIMNSWTTSWVVASGVIDGLLIVSVYDTAGDTSIKTFVVDLTHRTMWHFQNTPFRCFAKREKGLHETWAGVASINGRVATLSGIMRDTGGTDANGTAISPLMESAYMRFGMGPQQVKELFVGYELNGAGSQLKVDWTLEPATDASYGNYLGTGDTSELLNPEDLAGATGANGYHFRSVAVRDQGAGIAYRIQKNGSVATTCRIYNVAGTLFPQPGQRQV